MEHSIECYKLIWEKLCGNAQQSEQSVFYIFLFLNTVNNDKMEQNLLRISTIN